MKQITLTRGFFALVDDEDFEELSKHKWYVKVCGAGRNKYYAARTVRKPYKMEVRMHRQILRLPQWMEAMDQVVDHIVGTCALGHDHDGSGLDNRKCGLEIVTPEENMRRSKNWNKKVEEPWL